MTAIVGIQTSEGFAFGADGLTKNEHNQTICTETRKVFFASKLPDYNLAYAWCGHTGLNLQDGWFDFFETSAKVIEYLNTKDINGPSDRFFRVFSVLVRDHLVVRLGGITIPSQKFRLQSEVVACAAFMGYADGLPVAKKVFILHHNHQLEEPRLDDPTEFRFGVPLIMSGPDYLVHRDNEISRENAGSGVVTVEKCLKSFINMSRTESDPEYGGHIHIARITQNSKSWADDFAPMED